MKKLILVAAVIASSPSAFANSWVIRDLGVMPDRQTCMDRAELLLRNYKDKNSGGDINRGSWSVFAYGLGSSERDVVFSCPIFSGQTYGTIYSHDTRDSDDNEYAIDRLVEEYERRY
ncbi:MAG: hypothetical protein AAGJ85_04560 [Pseudomonadota bacterium]